MFDLTGRVALVTGAGRNLGAGIARCLAAQGARVAVNDLHADRAKGTVEEIAAAGGIAQAVPFDVTDAEAAAAGIENAAAALGPVDILVNNAGVPESMNVVKFAEMDPAEWRAYVDVNLYGVLHCTRAALCGMLERGFGRVITISSAAGQAGVPIGISLYGAGKGGALAWSRHLAVEVAGSGVTVNCIALGLMRVESIQDPALMQQLAASVPMGRVGSPEDVGACCVYVASDEAAWLTGQTIGLNGGSLTT